MIALSDQYQQTFNARMLNGLWQLVQHFGLTPMLQALQTHQQQSYGLQCPSPMAILYLLVEQAAQNQIQAHDDTEHTASIDDHQNVLGGIDRCSNTQSVVY